jgi:hypothetical protein
MSSDIIAMAREAWGLEFIPDYDVPKLERFAALVIEHYKDECESELNEAIKEMQERELGQ